MEVKLPNWRHSAKKSVDGHVGHTKLPPSILNNGYESI